ncbi:hypothetical protein VH22019_00051 [Vibrio phage VH2_2019]|nr:hypothetical protein VH22019_00051 [Vibrio phage VH2_2019]
MKTNIKLALIKFTLVSNNLRAAQQVAQLTNPDDPCTRQLEEAVRYLNDVLVDIAGQEIEPFGDIVWDTLNGMVNLRPIHPKETHDRVCALLETTKTVLLTF